MNERETEALRLRADIFKALGHPTRLWIVEALAEGPRCVADLAEGVEGGLSAVSQHLALLRQSGLVRDERRGRQIYYSLTFPCITEICALLNGQKPKRVTAMERLRKALGVVVILLVVGGGLSFALSRLCCSPVAPEMPAEFKAFRPPKICVPGSSYEQTQNTTTKKGINHETHDGIHRLTPPGRHGFRPGPGGPFPDPFGPSPEGADL